VFGQEAFEYPSHIPDDPSPSLTVHGSWSFPLKPSFQFIERKDEKEILKISKDPDLQEKMKGSIAPTIYGLDIEKEAMILQLFGGIAKEMPDGTRIRGDIHTLLVGDPGTAKSQMLAYMSKLAPRSVYASGKASSAAGLTAAAVRDEFGEGHGHWRQVH
jgi:replicative DNA helicase Mcm